MSSTDSQTIRTYDEIAPAYLTHWRDRSFLDGDIQSFVGLLPDQGLVLDVGCGPGFDAAQLRATGVKAVGLDRSWGMLCAGNGEFGPLLQGDFCRLPVADASLSGIWANASLLHLPRPLMPAALTEFHRVLVPGGIIYISVKLGRGSEVADSSYGHSAPRHYTYWEPAGLDAVLSAAHFSTAFQATYVSGSVTWLVRISRRP